MRRFGHDGRRRVALGLLLLVMAGVGCKNTFDRPPRWTVELSHLDYVEVMSGANAQGGETEGPMSQYILLGTGYLHRRTGASPRVSNEFWNERKDERWDSYETDAIAVPATYVQACFQHLVDLEFFDESVHKPPSERLVAQGVVVSAAINGRRRVLFSQDPRIQAMVAEIARQF